MYKETKRLIKKASLENKLVVFVGAGVSKNSGIPLWGTVIEQIKSKLEFDFKDETDYLKIPQYYFNARGFKEYNELVQEIFSYPDKSPNNLHRKIFDLKPAHIITTNYDDFLEKVADENGEFLEIIEKDTDIPYAKNDRLLVKMHGGFSNNNYVLKEDDYLNFSENFKLTETLIKSLIARNTVLFVGYSFNDPDTKQIFHWVKNALGKDFQRAYMLVCDNEYNQTISDYYKNLGINLVYSEKIKEFDCNNNDIYENTLKALDYFILNDEIDDFEQVLYNKLSEYENLNYIPLKYIRKAINKSNPSWSATVIGQGISIYCKNDTIFWDEFNKSDSINHSKILSIFSKSQLESIEYFKQSNERHNCDVDTKKRFNNSEYWDLLETNNLVDLNNFAESINIYDSNVLVEEKLKATFIYYRTQNYQKCLLALKAISILCKKKKDYLWHFICEYNIKQLSHLDWRDTTKININLQELVYKYNLISDEDSFLLELSNYSFLYSECYLSNEMFNNIKTDSKINFNIQEIDKLEKSVIDLYNFISYNFMMVHNYNETKHIFRNYFHACVASHFTPTRNQEMITGIIVGNYSLPELSSFAIICSTEYCDLKFLRNIFSNYNNKLLKISDEAYSLLYKKILNYQIASERNLIQNIDASKLDRLVYLSSKIKFSDEQISKLLKELINILKKEIFQFEYLNCFNSFMLNIARNNIDLINLSQIKEIIEIILSISETSKSNDGRYNWDIFNTIFDTCLYILKNQNSNIKFDKNKTSRFINAKGKLEFLKIYDFCDDISKQLICDYVNRNKVKPSLYFDALQLGIIVPDLKTEQIILDKVTKESSEKDSGVSLLKNSYISLLNHISNLYINDYLLEREKFKPFFDKDTDVFNFLIDPTKFQYDKFKLSWFSEYNFSSLLIKNTLKKGNTKENIAKVFMAKYEKEGLNKAELDIYFKYFISEE
ncbi:MAG: SIR2 family protein [Clostridia bacterium]